MADKAGDQEPTIEEILASIRQIISDDDEEEKKPAAKPAPPPPEPEPEEEEDDEVLELTEVVSKPARNPDPEPRRVEVDLRDPDPVSSPDDDEEDSALLTDSAANAALAGFARLASRAPIDRTGTGLVTIEDIVRELMKPMLREWLDIHLPPLIEKVVQKELQKVARRATEDVD